MPAAYGPRVAALALAGVLSFGVSDPLADDLAEIGVVRVFEGLWRDRRLAQYRSTGQAIWVCASLGAVWHDSSPSFMGEHPDQRLGRRTDLELLKGVIRLVPGGALFCLWRSGEQFSRFPVVSRSPHASGWSVPLPLGWSVVLSGAEQVLLLSASVVLGVGLVRLDAKAHELLDHLPPLRVSGGSP